eukprot:g4310.t1
MLLADLDTPLSVYSKLANKPYSYLFESVEASEKWGRYSMIGLPARELIRVRGNLVTREVDGEVLEEHQMEDPLDFIQQYQRDFYVAELEHLPRFSGGLVGYIGYDVVRYVEPRLKHSVPADELGVPDILLMLSDDLVIFDNFAGTLSLVSHADTTDPDAYEKSCDFQIVGASPEILARLDHGEVTVRPIAGTRRRGKTEEDDVAMERDMLEDPKEIAEHLMLIDLGRNDCGRVSQTGTVKVTEQMVVERYSHVMHITSNVVGQIKEGLDAIDVLRAVHPAGTLSGAPKIRAMEIIDELEPVKRGIYGGAVGYLGWNGDMDVAIAIRTGVIKDNKLYVQAGGGIVADSVPRLEWKETMNKARAMLRAASMSVMQLIMSGEATDAQIGGFLVALRIKGETVDEITGAARVMRALAAKVLVSTDNLVDTCGTGGDGSSLFNVSTASAIAAAAAGVRVAKHGNRSVSSKSGSADVLEAAGVDLGLNADQVARCIDTVGVGFMFAPAHHSAMKHAIGPRRELATRTIFNLLGPLTNPASAPNQVLGVFSKSWVRPLAEVLKNLGSQHVLVVHSQDGLDEISLAAPTSVAELRDGDITEYEISPEDLGLQSASLTPLMVDTAEASLALIKAAFSDSSHPAADMIALNAGAAIYVSGGADSLPQGVAMAQDALGSGLAGAKLSELAEFTQTAARAS